MVIEGLMVIVGPMVIEGLMVIVGPMVGIKVGLDIYVPIDRC
jgi:hypothetical protein